MKQYKPKVSIVVSTYNWPDALRICLLSIANQTILPDEVVIADDGSKEETANLIIEMNKTFPCPLIHVWHEDIGFRLTVIRNKAIVKASGEYIIQIDGDVILEKHFVEDHLLFAKEGIFTTGSRVGMSQELCENLLNKNEINIPIFTKGLKNKQNAFRNTTLSSFYRFRYKKDSPHYIKGCNMAFWRKDLIAVNGYNENMTGWGYEDNEIVARLLALGIKKQFIKFSGIVYHLYHTLSSHDRETINADIFKEVLSSKTTRCENGLDKYMKGENS